jgi:hypothetical protein
VGDEAVGAELAEGVDARGIRVVGENAAPAAGGLGDREQGLAVGRGGLQLAGEAERVLERLDAEPDAVGEDAADLGQGGVGLEAEAPRGHQSEGDRRGLARREHQRRDAVAGPQPIAAATAALALDRDAEIAQGDDVAPDGANVHAERRGELRAGRGRPVLKRLEQHQHAIGLRH